MPHILLNQEHINGDTRFQTRSAILCTTPYPPKVLIVGTYNEANILGNEADFFYGRNYFWPVFDNLFSNENRLLSKRILKSRENKIPSLGDVLNLCSNFKLTFADLITDVAIQLPNHDDKPLDAAVGNDQTTNNNINIVDYINQSQSITHVYATTKFGQLKNLKNLWESIKIGIRPGVNFGSILTPSGQGGIPLFEGLGRAGTIARYWLWVNKHDSPYGNFKNQEGYVHLDHDWLIQSGVNPVLF